MNAQDSSADTEERRKQVDRERNAVSSVLKDDQKCQCRPLVAINEFTRKTKALLTDKCTCSIDGQFRFVLTYASVLRTITTEAQGSTKKLAKQACASAMISKLQQDDSIGNCSALDPRRET